MENYLYSSFLKKFFENMEDTILHELFPRKLLTVDLNMFCLALFLNWVTEAIE